MPASPSTPRPGSRLLPVATLLLLAVSLVQAGLLIKSGALHGNDFKHLWAGAWLLRHGMNPYDPAVMFRAAENFRLGGVNPFVYLPSTGWMLAPLTWLRPEAAKLAWFGLNWLLAWACVLCGPVWLRVAQPWRARLAGAAFLCAAFPVYRQFTAGQMNIVTATLLLLAGGLLLRRRDALCGLVLACGFGWKIAPVLLIPALLVLRRPRGFGAGMLGCAALVVAMFIFTPFDTYMAGWSTIGEMGYGRSTWAQFGMDFYRDPFNQSLNALFHHLFTENPHTRPLLALRAEMANRLTLVATLGLGLSWLIAVWGQLPHRRALLELPETAATQLRLFWAATLLMLLAPSLLWDHYCTQLLPILLWLFGSRRLDRLPRMLGALLLMIALCIPWLHAAPQYSHGAGMLLMSLRLWPLLALFAWLLVDQDRETEM